MADFSSYVLRKLAKREISVATVERVLEDPDFHEPCRTPPRYCYFRRINNCRMCVVVEPFDHDQVVTAFEITS
jgi:hypothetical protein